MTTIICTASFLSTLSLRRATTNPKNRERRSEFLSTLSLRRATAKRLGNALEHLHFYPRSPCGERLNGLRHKCASFYFYPRSPCGERRFSAGREYDRAEFLSTLSLRRATPAERHANSQQEFLSTLSLRRATSSKTHDRHKTAISIHALLAESDDAEYLRL